MKYYDYGVNVDKLKICLNVPDGLFEYLKEHYNYRDENNNRVLDEIEFYLRIVDEDDNNITAIANIKDSDGDFKLGTFIFSNTSKYKGKAFFQYENRALYTPFLKLNDGEQHNYICVAQYIWEYYKMEFNNITEVEVALDTPYNYIAKIRSMIKNVERYDLILNGSKVEENDKIMDGYGEYYTRSRIRLSKSPTIYHSHAKNTDLSMKVYDKSAEMNNSTPYKLEYLPQWLGWNTTEQIYRVEVKLHNTNIRDFCDKYGKNLYPDSGEHSNVLNLLGLKLFRMALFYDAINRLMYFRDKKTRIPIYIPDLLGI